MAKIYGNRWKVSESLASGGQAELFKVHDLLGKHPGELVLKRVRNPKRHERFRNEVEAIKRLEHPNIIRLIDHSALDGGDAASDRQFIVMPYASQGDLSKRAAIYANNPDGVVHVAKSLALALQTAHKAGIIHRDVKPENILFPSMTHDLWLGDFGICLTRDLDRATPADEVVGPVQFMAPELEGGGKLEVTTAADVYSLGKVIYYMLSGGVVLPRERLHEPEYSKIFSEGERQRLLESLLSRMICGLSDRYASMDEVLRQLEHIENWEKNARLLPIHAKTLSAIEEMKRKALVVHRQIDSNAETRKRRDAMAAATVKGTLDWFQAELTKTAGLIEDGQGITAGVRKVDGDKNDSPPLNHFRPGPAIELLVRNKYEMYAREHLLRFSVCNKIQIRVTSRVLTGREPSMQVPPDEPEHLELAVIPAYGCRTDGNNSRQYTDWQFFTRSGGLYRPVANQLQLNPNRRGQGQPQQPVEVQALVFKTELWPGIADSYPVLFQSCVDAFVSAMNVVR